MGGGVPPKSQVLRQKSPPRGDGRFPFDKKICQTVFESLPCDHFTSSTFINHSALKLMFDSFTKILKLPKGFFHQIRQLLRDCIICILLFVGFRKVVQNLINSFKVSRLKQISGVLQNHGGTKPRTGLRTWIQGSKFEEIEPVSIFSLLLLFIIHSSSYLPLSIIVLVIIISGMLPCVQQR